MTNKMGLVFLLMYGSGPWALPANGPTATVTFVDNQGKPLIGWLVKVDLPQGVIVKTSDSAGKIVFRSGGEMALFSLAIKRGQRPIPLGEDRSLPQGASLLEVRVDRAKLQQLLATAP